MNLGLETPWGRRRAPGELGYFRRHLSGSSGQLLSKEWFHVTLHGQGIDAIVNFSLVEQSHARAGRHGLAQVGCFVRESVFNGDIQRFDASDVAIASSGRVIAFGPNRLQVMPDGIDVRVKLRDCEVELELSLTAATLPVQVTNVALGGGAYMHWKVMPRFLANGRLCIEGRAYVLRDAPAYHDHNWGRFNWSNDFSWEWGYALPGNRENPWSIVFVRLLDRAHLNDLMRGLFIWHGDRPRRLFRANDVQTYHDGLLRPRRVLKLPRIMALVHPGQASDVPRRLLVRAARGRDRLSLEFLPDDVAALVVPHETEPEVTVIHEVSGRFFAEGRIDGARVELEGRSIFEFLGS